MTPAREFQGKVALITGAARGIGRSIARRFAQEGAVTFIADINKAGCIDTAAEFQSEGLDVAYVEVDLSQSGQADALVQSVYKKTSALDILVNNARAGGKLDFTSQSETDWDLSLNVGLKAAFFASQSAIKLMAAHGGCRIVNIASVAANLVTNESPAYHASKAGLVQITKYLAVAGAPHRCRANCILPGLIVQDEHRQRFERDDNADYRSLTAAYQPLGDVGSSNDVAEAALFLCSEKSKYISGATLTVDGAATVQDQFGLLLRNRSSAD